MLKKLFGFALPGIFIMLLSAACELGNQTENEKPHSISIMTWNLQALFDGIDNGSEYDDYLMSAGWSNDKYLGRISIVSKALNDMDVMPDIIAFQEIESEIVINDLAASLKRYKWTHFANAPNMSLGVGVISRFPIIESKAHSISNFGDTSPRPVLELRICVNPSKKPCEGIDSESCHSGENSIILFVCHWKSKLGGEDLTEAGRRASARIILRRIRELVEQEPELPVIVLGDLNENHDEFYRRNGEVICALLPDDPRCAELTGFVNMDSINGITSAKLQKDFFILSKNKPPQARYFTGEPLVFYSPWGSELNNGSYYYKNAWETIDHFLLTHQFFNQKELEFDSCKVLDYPPFASTAGRPMAYNPRTGYGLSDHLPLLLYLKRDLD